MRGEKTKYRIIKMAQEEGFSLEKAEMLFGYEKGELQEKSADKISAQIFAGSPGQTLRVARERLFRSRLAGQTVDGIVKQKDSVGFTVRLNFEERTIEGFLRHSEEHPYIETGSRILVVVTSLDENRIVVRLKAAPDQVESFL
jgi:predicted RNA-binding protein (virulence factor B family)